MMTAIAMKKAETAVRKQQRNRRQNRVMMTVAVMKKAVTGVRKQLRNRRTEQGDEDSSSDEESWDRR